MKNLAKIFMGVVLLAGVTSCVQDTTVDVGGFKPTQTISISMGDVTKTALGEKDELSGKYPLYWSAGDQVSINGVASNALAEDFVQNKVAQFEFSGDLGSTPYKVSYPATETPGNVVFAAVQTHTEGTFSAGAAPMYGESNSLQIEMQHLVGVLKLPIVGAEGITLKSVSIVGADAETRLAGAYTVELVEGVAQVTPTTDATNRITYDCAGLALSDTPQVLHITVPEGVYETLALIITATDAEGKTLAMRTKVQAPEAKPIKPGVVREFSPVTFADNDPTFLIEDSESLIEFKTLCENGNFIYTGARVTKDFTFEGEWSPVSGFVNDLEFDGGDFTITGLPAQLFTVANGFIHNVKLNSTAVLSDTNLYHGLLANTFTGTISDCEVSGSIEHTALKGDYCSVAGVIGRASGLVTLTNVVNKAKVTAKLANKADTRFYAGGVCGVIRYDGDNVSFINCSNSGTIETVASVEGEGLPKAHGVGGLIGGHYKAEKVYVKDCSNSGDITLNHSSTDGNHLGGLIGSCCSLIEMTASEGKFNTNSGAITTNGTHTGECSVAGLLGYTSGANSSFKKLKNLEGGNVTVNATNTGSRFNIGGVAPYVNGAGISFEECYNHATLTYAGESEKSYLVIGGVVTRSNGAQTYTNLHNHGNIVISTEIQPTAFYVGGVMGLIHGAATISNCSNNHDLTINAITTGDAHIGGVIAVSGENSTMTASTLTNNNAITFGGNPGGAYYAGGVIGSIGNAGVTGANLVNGATVTFSGTAGTSLYAGGVVGSTKGAIAPAEGGTIGAKNSGAVNINGAVTTTNYIGGVIGYASKNVTGIENDGLVTIANDAGAGGGDQYSCNAAGGVIGRLVGTSSAKVTATNVTNKKKVVFKQTGALKTVQYANHGGVVGQSSYATLDNCDNTADSVVFKNVYNTLSGNSNDFRHGAIVGGVRNTTIKNCDNGAHIGTAANNTFRHQNYGGIVGWIIDSTIESCSNSGDIHAMTPFSPKRCYFGGIVGTISRTPITSCTYSGDIKIDSAVQTADSGKGKIFQLFAGGIVGYDYTGVNVISSCTFDTDSSITLADGLIDLTNAGTCLAGITGYQRSTATTPVITGCFSKGVITANSTNASANAKATSNYIGGIIGRQLSPLTGCEFTGTVSAPGNTNVGAISGNTYADTRIVSNCKVDGYIQRVGLASSQDITSANFSDYIYSAAWTDAAANGNYGVEFNGGGGID